MSKSAQGPFKHLLDIETLGREGIDEILRVSQSFVEIGERPIPRVPALKGKEVVTLFFEDSTRTRLSFEIAGKRLSADVMNFAAKSSSLSKGESIRDTAQTIASMGVSAIVVRHPSPGVPHQIARWTDTAVINAGDGPHSHPTQALLDCLTLRQALGRNDLDGVHIVIVGDFERSRVARSDVAAFSALGADITLVAPPTMLPSRLDPWPVRVSHDLDAVLPKADVIVTLRPPVERTNEMLVPSVREYVTRYGITTSRFESLDEHVLIMEAGPLVRGVQMSEEVAESPRCLMNRQSANGVPVRMAVLYLAVLGEFNA